MFVCAESGYVRFVSDIATHNLNTDTMYVTPCVENNGQQDSAAAFRHSDSLDDHVAIASYVFCCKQFKLQQRDTCMDVQNLPKSDFVERCHWQLYHRQIRISVEFVRDKLVFQLLDFGG